MDQTQENPMYENEDESKQKSKNGEPIVVINDLNGERDVTNLVEQILSKSEFSDASSIYLVVPSDDNEADNSSDGRNSTICIQISANPTKWKTLLNSSENDILSQRRISSTAHGVRISAKGKKFFMEGLPTTIQSFHNKETMFEYQETQTEKKKNKLCQITTPNEVVRRFEHKSHVVSTDTTADRPCCCTPRHIQYSDYSSNDRCVTPLLVNHGLNGDPFRSAGLNIKPHVSIMSVTLSASHIAAARIAPPICPPATNKPTQEIAKEPNIKPCQCTAEKLTELLQKAVETGRVLNMKSTGCGGVPPQPVGNQLGTSGGVPPRHQHPVTRQAPAAMPSGPGTYDDCPNCLHPPKTDYCGCDTSKKPVKLKPACPCGWHQPRYPKVPGPLSCKEQAMMANDGRQSVSIRADPTHQRAQTHLLGAAGESMQVETGETYTQAGTKQTRFTSSIGISTDPNKDCACKRGKKNKKNKCECPESEPEPTPELKPTPGPEPVYQPELGPQWVGVGFNEFEWVDEREVKKLKSGLTERVSGFKMRQKKRPPPPPEIEYTLDDALRYYAAMKPDLFRTIVEEQKIMIRTQDTTEQETTGHKDKKGRKGKNGKRKAECECPPAPPPPPVSPPQAPTMQGIPPITSESAPSGDQVEEEDEGPFRGLKFKMAGKGSGSPGLTGICCFDLFQESFTTW